MKRETQEPETALRAGLESERESIDAGELERQLEREYAKLKQYSETDAGSSRRCG